MNIFKRGVIFASVWVLAAWMLTVSAWAQPAATNTQTSKAVSNVWYTQIGQWHYWPVDSMRRFFSAKRGKSYLYHDAQLDGTRSGEATANVRLNYSFVDINRFEATFVLGGSPALAGMLLQNKQVTYYFFVKRSHESDSLLIRRFSAMQTSSLAGIAVKYSDTTRLTVSITASTVMAGVAGTFLSIGKNADFQTLTTAGFECQRGSVKVYGAEITAKNSHVKETFDHTTLVNLHLEKVFKGIKTSR